MSGIVFEQSDLVEALTDLLNKRGLTREGGYTLEWYISQSTPNGKQIGALLTPNVQKVLNKEGREE